LRSVNKTNKKKISGCSNRSKYSLLLTGIWGAPVETIVAVWTLPEREAGMVYSSCKITYLFRDSPPSPHVMVIEVLEGLPGQTLESGPVNFITISLPLSVGIKNSTGS
jgi:hypothetical protein